MGLTQKPPKGDIRPMQGYERWQIPPESGKVPCDLSVCTRW